MYNKKYSFYYFSKNKNKTFFFKAADIHYSTTDETNIPLRKNAVYLLGSFFH